MIFDSGHIEEQIRSALLDAERTASVLKEQLGAAYTVRDALEKEKSGILLDLAACVKRADRDYLRAEKAEQELRDMRYRASVVGMLPRDAIEAELAKVTADLGQALTREAAAQVQVRTLEGLLAKGREERRQLVRESNALEREKERADRQHHRAESLRGMVRKLEAERDEAQEHARELAGAALDALEVLEGVAPLVEAVATLLVAVDEFPNGRVMVSEALANVRALMTGPVRPPAPEPTDEEIGRAAWDAFRVPYAWEKARPDVRAKYIAAGKAARALGRKP